MSYHIVVTETRRGAHVILDEVVDDCYVQDKPDHPVVVLGWNGDAGVRLSKVQKVLEGKTEKQWKRFWNQFWADHVDEIPGASAWARFKARVRP